MSRLMSVAFTEQAVVERRKTVTRRKGWTFLKPGDHLTLCRKVQGRRRADGTVDPIVRLAEVEILHVTREPLDRLLVFRRNKYKPSFADTARRWSEQEMASEGFPGMDPGEFVHRFFTTAQGMRPTDEVTRIEWRYVCGSGFCECGGCVL